MREGTLFLTGFMGTGKSTVGKRLAALLGTSFVDLDEEIEKDVGARIAIIFQRDGEAAFRRHERRLLQQQNAGVVALGGGTLLSEENRALVRERGHVVALTASLDELVLRLKGQQPAKERPLLKGGDLRTRIEHLLDERGEMVASADRTVDTTGRSPDDVAKEIATWIRSA